MKLEVSQLSNPVIESLVNHRSIRKFKPDPVDEEILKTILHAGTRAATGGNLQPYSLVVIDDPELREKIGLAHAPMVILALADQYRVRRWLEINNPDREIICDRHWGFFLALWDAYIALHTISVAAESLGLGTCYYGFALELDLKELFKTPEHVFSAGMITVGWPDEEPELSKRLPLDAIVHRNEYRQFSDDEIRELYRDRESVWDTLPEELKSKLMEKGIHHIAHGIAGRKFTEEFNAPRSVKISKNLENSKFRI